MAAAKLKLLIADDHAILRSAVKRLLADVPDIDAAGEARNSAEVIQCLQTERYDVLLLDLNMPGQNPLDLLMRIKVEYPSLAVLILTMYPEEQFGVRAFVAGASGYLNKQSTPEHLVAAIRRVRDGGTYISGNVAVAVARNLHAKPTDSAAKRLSDREFTVLRGIAAGKSITEIARELSVSTKTISTYRARLLNRLDLRSNIELARYAVEHGLAN